MDRNRTLSATEQGAAVCSGRSNASEELGDTGTQVQGILPGHDETL